MASGNRVARSITLGILLAAAVGIIISLLNFTNSEKKELETGDSAPLFSLTDTDGNTVSLQDYKGKVILLNFWASWCEPCRNEMPAVQESYNKYKDQGFVVLGVNIAENQVTAKGFANRLGVTFPVLLDSDRKVTQQYKVIPIPTSFLIDRNGKVQAVFKKELTLSEISGYVETLIAKP